MAGDLHDPLDLHESGYAPADGGAAFARYSQQVLTPEGAASLSERIEDRLVGIRSRGRCGKGGRGVHGVPTTAVPVMVWPRLRQLHDLRHWNGRREGAVIGGFILVRIGHPRSRPLRLGCVTRSS